MVLPVISSTKFNSRYNFAQIAATTLAIKTGYGLLGGIFVSAASATPTITIYDNTTAVAPKIIDVFTPVAATKYSFDTIFNTALSVVISGTVSCTIFYQ